MVVAGQEGMVASNPDSHGKKKKIKPTEKPSKQPGDSPSPKQEERRKPKLKSGSLRVGWVGRGRRGEWRRELNSGVIWLKR